MPLVSSAVLIFRRRFVSEISKGALVLLRIAQLKVVYLPGAALAREEKGGESSASKDEVREEEEEEEEEEQSSAVASAGTPPAAAAAAAAPTGPSPPAAAASPAATAAAAAAVSADPLGGSFAAKKGCGSPAASPVALLPAHHQHCGGL